jgi:hypothetical protein
MRLNIMIVDLKNVQTLAKTTCTHYRRFFFKEKSFKIINFSHSDTYAIFIQILFFGKNKFSPFQKAIKTADGKLFNWTFLVSIYLFIRMTIILKKLNTFVKDSRRLLHITQSDHRQTTAMGGRLLYEALFVPQHHSHKLVTSTNPHLCMRCVHLPCSVWKWFNNTQLCRHKSKPGGRTLRSTIRSQLTMPQSRHQELKKAS